MAKHWNPEQESDPRFPTPKQKKIIYSLMAERRVSDADKDRIRNFLLPRVTNKGVNRTIAYLHSLPMKETSLTSTS